MTSSNLRDRLFDDLDSDTTSLVGLCSSLVKIPSDNPPGDTYTPPDARIVRLLQKNHAEITGREPYLSFTSGGTDCRFWRLMGVPAVSYGPKVYGMGGVDEHITLEDLETTAKVHMGTIIDFLTRRR